MLIFAGLEGDAPALRAPKLKALQEYYHESAPRAWNMLGASDMAKSNTNRGSNLVVNSHGSLTTFARMDAQQFFDALTAKGFQEGSFQAVYLMACEVGQQSQKNSILENFARDLFSLFQQNSIPSKLYAPRGTLAYDLHSETKLGQTYWVVDKMYIKTPERNYPLNEGVLLIRP
jgi:hypothetical protein